MSAIVADSLTRRFDDVLAVDALSFEVASGEIVGLLGANGAGKTTTMRMLLGLIPPTSGSARVAGQSVLEIDRRVMGYVPQGLGLYPELTVRENLEFSAAAFGVDVPPLEDEGLAAVADRRVGQLPLGSRRRVAFAAARAHRPEVLILDEPTSGVGPLGRARLWETIHATAEKGAAVLVSTHHMDEAEECDRVVLMASGRLVASGTVSEIVGTMTSVHVEGSIPEPVALAIERAGGNLLVDGTGWRVVGLEADRVRSLAGKAMPITVVPATFEETFVAWST